MTLPPREPTYPASAATNAMIAVTISRIAITRVPISFAVLLSVLFLSCSTSTSSSLTLRFSFLNSSEFFLMADASNP